MTLEMLIKVAIFTSAIENDARNAVKMLYIYKINIVGS